MSTPWKTDKWFVSPWNYLPEVTAGLHFPNKIEVHDITLRDGEQQAGIEFTRAEKVKIATKLAEAGVHRIEAGMPAVSPDDEAAIKDIVKLNLGPKIFAFSRCMVEDVKRAADCGVEGIVVEIPCSEHIIEYAYRWPLQKALDLSIEATRYAHSQGLYTVFFPIDSTRSEINWYLDLIEKVATEGHMDALAIVDTFGVLSPHATSYLIKKVRERINKPLETHFHVDFGHGITNTILALAAGAEVIHTTVTGVGERAGNVPMEETVLSLLTQYGIDLGLDYSKLCELSDLVLECARVAIPPNRPVVGKQLYWVESGIIASWVTNCGDERATEVFPYHWDLVGQGRPQLVLGKGSGLPSVMYWLDRIRVEATAEQEMEILRGVKRKSLETKRLLTEDEFCRIVEAVVGRPVPAKE
jgi:isopropylmalate/homocitrate/citramalate synthase